MKTALVAGSTGLIGSHLLTMLLDDASYSAIKAISRKPLSLTHPKLQNIVLDFDTIATSGDLLRADDVFCCLGTTMKQAGSKTAFEKVDYTYPVELAKVAKEKGTAQFLLITALGANPTSSIYYNQVKGKVEVSIAEIGFKTLHILRPSLLTGERTEKRTGEDTAKWFYKIFGFLIPGKYKAIEGKQVAKAMLALAKQNKPGKHIHESSDLQVLG